MTTKDTEAAELQAELRARADVLTRWPSHLKRDPDGICTASAMRVAADHIGHSVNERAGLVAECEKRAALLGESERLRLRFLDTIAARDREVARLREALERAYDVLDRNKFILAPMVGAREGIKIVEALAASKAALRSVQEGAKL